jgi:hypothetical protein
MTVTPAAYSQALTANAGRALLAERLAACRWFLARHESQLCAMADSDSQTARNVLVLAIARQRRAIADIHAALYC